MTKELAEQIVYRLILDITDRRGLSNEWGNIDEDIQEEIKEEWVRLIGEITGNF